MYCPDCRTLYGANATQCAKCLDWNNTCRLIAAPIMLGASTAETLEYNVAKALENVQKFAHEIDLETLFVFMKRIEAVAAGASLAYNQRTRVNSKLADPTGAEKAKDFSKALKEQTIANLPKKEKVLLDARGKAIKALTDLGIPSEIAEKQVDERMAQAGRVAPRV